MTKIEATSILATNCEKNGENTYSLKNFIFDIQFETVNVHKKDNSLELLMSITELDTLQMLISSIKND